ncbi:MAG: ABC transporter substrate-binding protein [Candidatus Rokuibacteriota bacterium]
MPALLALVLCPGAPAGAEQPAPPRVGWLTLQAEDDAPARLEAFRRGLRDLGYVEGQNIVIETGFARNRSDRLPDLARELVRSRVSVIVAVDPPTLRAARDATGTTPIVTRMSDDPVAAGLAVSLARPGGHVTGLYSLAEELSAKRLELLREAFPRIRRVAVLMSSANAGSQRWFDETGVAARSLKIQLQPLDVKSADGLEAAFRAAVDGHAEALITLRNPLIVRNTKRIVSLAARYRLPAIYDAREFVEAGGLMSYGTNLAELYRHAAVYVDKILKGAKPVDLPIEQPTTFELVVNQKAAKALGLTLPPSFLVRADRVIN